MVRAIFNPNGGPIRVDITAGYAQPGSYALLLWGANTNAVVGEWRGNFINNDDDYYFLPTPLEKNNGRIIDCIATFTLLPPIKQFLLKVEVLQDGNILATDVREGESEEQTVSVEIFIALASNGE